MNETEIKKYGAAVAKALKMFGVNIGTRGYDYTKDALILIASDDALSKYGAIQLYQTIAEKYNDATYARVERCIRHFVDNAYSKGNSFFSRVIGVTAKKPTNTHFLKAMSEYLKYNDI